MIKLYFLHFLMICLALCLLGFPFVKSRPHSYLPFLIIILFMVPATIMLYRFSGDKRPLQIWLGGGQRHYQLLEILNRLGGIDGAISRVKDKLRENPNDSEGWFILAKLYLAEHKYALANQALSKIQKLNKKNRPMTKNL